MILKIYAEPAIEPVSLQDMKEHLRLDSGAFVDNLDPDQLIAPGSHAVSTVYTLLETLTLDVAPGGAGWAAGDTITGVTSTKTCKIVEKLTALTYTIWNRSGNFTLNEVLTNGTATADQGAAFPVVTAPYADVLGYSAIIILDSGINLATGTVDAKIQECDTATGTYTDWTGGAFTQVTTANDNAIQKIAYTGSKQYIRVVAKVLLAACEFGVQVVRYASDTTEDDLLTALITAARQQAETITHRALITQTWDAWLDEFLDKDFITVPYGQLQSITASSFTYTDSDGDATIMVEDTDFLVDTNQDPGRLVLPYGISWPSFTAYPVNPITFRFVCGYGATATSVPAGIRTAIKMIVEDLFNQRSTTHTQQAGNITENKAVMALLYPFRLWSF